MSRFGSQISLAQFAEVDAICWEFEGAWQAGDRPSLSDYLQRISPEGRSVLMRELVVIDLDYRSRLPHSTPTELSVESYTGRFPEYQAPIQAAFTEAEARGSVTSIDGLTDGATAKVESSGPAETAWPRMIGRYHVLRPIGQGSFAVVYLAADPELNRFVAIKVPHPELGLEIHTHLKSEAQKHAQLHHPRIVPVFDVGTDDHVGNYLVSRYIRGDRITSVCRREGWNVRKIVETMWQVADGLRSAHEAGLVHRDIKPANILIEEQAGPVLLDFGLSLPIAETGTGAKVAGTPAYMSPEQARRQADLVDEKSDIFSWGIVFYELLAGQRPFKSAGSVAGLLHAILEDSPQPLRSINAAVPTQLEAICAKCLAKEPSERYASVAQLQQDLSDWLHPKSIQRVWKLASVAVAVLALLLVGMLFRAEWVRQQEIAEGWLSSLLVAQPQDVDRILEEMDRASEPQRSRLVQRISRVDRQQLQPGQLLRLLAAQVAIDGKISDEFVHELLRASLPDFMAHYRIPSPSSWQPRLEQLWRILDAMKTESAERLRAGLLLAWLDPQSARWQVHAPALARQLIDQLPAIKASLINHHPLELADIVLDPWLEQYADTTDSETDVDLRKQLVDAIAWQGHAAPGKLFRAIRLSRGHELLPLVAKFLRHRNQALQICQAELDSTADWNADEPTARAITNALVVLMRLGDTDRVWAMFQSGPVPAVRSLLIHRCAELQVDPQLLVQRLLKRDSTLQDGSTSERAGLYLAMGEYSRSALDAESLEKVLAAARNDYFSHDRETRGAAEWCLRVWGEESWLASADARLTETEIQQLPESASSFANQLGQKFVVLGPARFWAGSDNPGLKSLNPRQERTIEHRFAIGAVELQRKYFLACLADMHIAGDNSNPLTPSLEMPETALQMFHVGLYCNWLSAQVGLPESEWCFIPGSRTEEGVANYDEQTRLKDNCVDLLGYRVPSELEWEYACRAGTTSETYFGDTREFSLKFAKLETTQAAPGLTQPIGDDVNSYTLHPCGRLKPNGFGLFDMFGNNMEYAVGQASMTQAPGYESVVGFHFLALRRRITAAGRQKIPQDIKIAGAGFRLARTLKRTTAAASPEQPVPDVTN